VYKRMILLLFFFNASLLFAQADPVFNEILYDPTGANSGNQLIEIKNVGDETANIGGWWLCKLLTYTQLPAGVTIPADGIIVLHVGGSGTNTSTDIYLSSMSALNASASDLGLYVNASFTSSSSMQDFVQWGSGGRGRESVAVSKGIWTAGNFVPDVAEGHSIEYDGDGEHSSDWVDQPTPTIGQENGIVTSLTREKTLPSEYILAQNYPNPFNPVTTIAYQLPQAGRVSIIVYDLLGSEVATLVNNVQSAGIHTVKWNAINVASGIYFYRLKAGSFTQTRKLVVIK